MTAACVLHVGEEVWWQTHSGLLVDVAQCNGAGRLQQFHGTSTEPVCLCSCINRACAVGSAKCSTVLWPVPLHCERLCHALNHTTHTPNSISSGCHAQPSSQCCCAAVSCSMVHSLQWWTALLWIKHSGSSRWRHEQQQQTQGTTLHTSRRAGSRYSNCCRGEPSC